MATPSHAASPCGAMLVTTVDIAGILCCLIRIDFMYIGNSFRRGGGEQPVSDSAGSYYVNCM